MLLVMYSAAKISQNFFIIIIIRYDQAATILYSRVYRYEYTIFKYIKTGIDLYMHIEYRIKVYELRNVSLAIYTKHR